MKNDAVKTEDRVTITRSEYESFLALKSANAYLESANKWLEEQLKRVQEAPEGKNLHGAACQSKCLTRFLPGQSDFFGWKLIFCNGLE